MMHTFGTDINGGLVFERPTTADGTHDTAAPARPPAGTVILARNANDSTALAPPSFTTLAGGRWTYTVDSDETTLQIQVSEDNGVTWSGPLTSAESTAAALASGDNAASAVATATAAQITANDALSLSQSSGARSINGRTPDANGAVTLIPSDIGALSSTGPLAAANVTGLAAVATSGNFTDLSNRPPIAIPLSQKGAASGVAALDAGGNVTNASGAIIDGSAPSVTAVGAIIDTNRRLYYLDAYDAFLAGGKWVSGQGNTGTTLTAAVSAGASVLPVTSATGILAGVQVVVSEGTAQQAIYTVASVSGTNVTINGTVTYALASGSNVTPIWTNSTHLTPAGWTAFAYFIANAKTASGNYVITGTAPKVTFLGDSWFAFGAGAYATALQARIPGAVVVNAGVSGDTSQLLINRFDTDVPADSTYVVINEPGVNDVAGADVSIATQVANLVTLVRKIRALGATPVLTGHVPLFDYPRSLDANNRFKAIVGTGVAFPAADAGASFAAYGTAPSGTCLAVGVNSLRNLSTGISNTGFGPAVLANVTTGNNNTALGDHALISVTTGSGNSAFGQAALYAATGSDNVGFGSLAGYSLSTGISNTLIGKGAGYAPAGVTANALTTGNSNVFIGNNAGGSAASNASVAIGVNATATAYYSTAIGTAASATKNGSVAIGIDSGGAAAASTTIDEFALGTAKHTVRVAGVLRLDKGQTTVGAAGAASALPATPSKYLSVVDSTGTEYVIPAYAKA